VIDCRLLLLSKLYRHVVIVVKWQKCAYFKKTSTYKWNDKSITCTQVSQSIGDHLVD